MGEKGEIMPELFDWLLIILMVLVCSALLKLKQ